MLLMLLLLPLLLLLELLRLLSDIAGRAYAHAHSHECPNDDYSRHESERKVF